MTPPNTFVAPPLSDEQLEAFHRDGYLVVSQVLDNCGVFLKETVGPHLAHHEQNTPASSFATGEYDPQVHTEIPGIMIRNDDGSNPLPNGDWIIRNPKLLSIINQLHGGSDDWEWLHPDNVGWIHVRFPVKNEQQFDHRWHVDGGHFDPHKLLSPEQSIVVLPVLQTIKPGGGSTVVLPKSHHYMAQLLHSKSSLSKIYTQDCRAIGSAWPQQHVEVAPCHAGDVILMHPFLVHAAGFQTDASAPKRVTFNLGTRWNRAVRIMDTENNATSWLETSFKRSLNETLPEVSVREPYSIAVNNSIEKA